MSDKKLVPLIEYIDQEFHGNKSKFARAFGVRRQDVHQILKNNDNTEFVVDDVWVKARYKMVE